MPDFKRPPVAETALGVEFLPITGWTPSHFALFAREIEKDYGRVEIRDDFITSTIERFGPEAKRQPTVTVDLSHTPMRWWYVDDGRGRLLQLQRDRFVHNWRKASPEATYPRYPETRVMFETAWRRFLRFVEAQGLESPTVIQCQMDYVNHLTKGDGWETPADLNKVSPLVGGAKTVFLPAPEVVIVAARYALPSEQGRLHVAIQPALRNVDQVEILQLTMTARGKPGDGSTNDILKWLDVGHEWIVRGFVEVTTPEMHKRWGRTG